MNKISVPALAKEISGLTGIRLSILRTISRQLRQKGMLSEAGRGVNAAPATPYDAAYLLLTALAELSPVNSATVAEQIRECKPDYEIAAKHGAPADLVAERRERYENFMRGDEIPRTPFALIVYLLNHRDYVAELPLHEIVIERTDRITVSLRFPYSPEPEIGYTEKPLPAFTDKFGISKIRRTLSIRAAVLLEISAFLGIEDERAMKFEKVSA